MTSIEQQLNLVVVAQPINAIKDADILERLWKGFEDQLWKAKTIASERLRLGGDSSVAPTFPMLETNASDNADETSRKTLRKRGRKTASKVLFQVPFSFQPPEFCLKENINLDIVLLNRFKNESSWGNHVPKFSIEERLKNWVIEKRERMQSKDKEKPNAKMQDYYYIHSASQKTLRSHQEVIEFLLDVEIPRKGGSKKAKVVGAVDNQSSSCDQGNSRFSYEYKDQAVGVLFLVLSLLLCDQEHSRNHVKHNQD
ncbi:hypothetical protein AAZX31_05G068900 [Glycine max]